MPDTLRYAVLHHTGVAQPHYDLLIEVSAEAPLHTWRCEAWPLVGESLVTRLPDHRRIYLEYEDPISGGRGEVTRVDEGDCVIELDAPGELRARLAGRSGNISLQLKLAHEQRWMARQRA